MMQLQQHPCKPDWSIALLLLDATVTPVVMLSSCKNCGTPMPVKGAYCGPKCKEAHTYTTSKIVAEQMRKARAAIRNGKSEVAKVCVICGKDFYPKVCLSHHQKTCGPECQREMNLRHKREVRAAAHKPITVTKTCLHCGTSFKAAGAASTKLYCSKPCAGKYKSAKRKAAKCL
jgi:predicted nucleic acid-binding Zn ribbon protein